MIEYKYLFDDSFFLWLWHNFSFIMIAVPAAIAALLKIIAKLHPGVPCDEIMELFKVFFTKPGTPMEMNRRATDQKEKL